MLKNKVAVVLVLVAVGSANVLYGQGSLTPPGAPAPTMKSLDQIEARTPISSLPITLSVPGSYYLTTNLTGTSGSDGITVTANDVTLDLNGFSLVGVAGSKNGINVFGARTTILNGSIRNWGTNGIAAVGRLNTVARSLVVSSNGVDGIECGVHGLVESCIAEANTNNGIYVGNGTTVRNCEANRNGQSGIFCYINGSFSQGSIIAGCTVAQNSIGITGCANGLIHDNDLVNNSFAGLDFSQQGTRVENNHFAYNYNGVQTSGLTNLVIHNSFVGNTNAAILNFTAGLPIGPLIPASGIATNTNPNANFSF